MPKARTRKLRGKLKKRISEKSAGTIAVYVILRVIVLIVLIRSFFLAQYESVFTCLLTLLLFTLPALVERHFRVKLPSALECIALLLIFCAEILGEFDNFYFKFPYWDILLHTVNGFLFAAVGFALADVFNERTTRFTFRLSPLFLSIVAFCFSMTVGVLWEFFEFACDWLLYTDMQKDTVIHRISTVTLDPLCSNTPVVIEPIGEVLVNGQALGVDGYLEIGLIDTMSDLFVNFIGALVFCIIGFFYVKSRGRQRFASHFIPVLREQDAPSPPPQNDAENHP